MESVVPNLQQDQTEFELLQANIANARTNIRRPRVPAPSIRATPIDKVSRSSRLFAMAFPTLFPTGAADPNEGRIRSVKLADWGIYMLRFYNNRFGRHPRFRFFLFNLLLRERARGSARYFIKKNSSLADLSLDELKQQLDDDNNTILNNVVRQGKGLSGTRPFWRAKSTELIAQCRCLPHLSPIFVTFSCADHQ